MLIHVTLYKSGITCALVVTINGSSIGRINQIKIHGVTVTQI